MLIIWWSVQRKNNEVFLCVQGVEEIGWRSKGPSPYPIQQNSPARLKRAGTALTLN